MSSICVRQWLEADDILEGVPADATDQESRLGEALWQRIAANHPDLPEGEAFRGAGAVPAEPKSRKRVLLSMGIAASLMLCTTLLILTEWPGRLFRAAQKTVVVPNAAKGELTLADGTTVYLNAGSKLNYPEQFGRYERVVELQGEAFFDVARDTDRPFRIVTDRTVVEVLGTAFNLKAYPGEEQRLEVVRGAVSFQSSSRKKQLAVKAGQSASLDDKQAIQYGSPVETESPLWREDALVFKNNTLKEVANVVERLYDVKIQFQDEAMQNLRFTGKFTAAPLKTVLEDIGYVLKIKHSASEKQINFYQTNN